MSITAENIVSIYSEDDVAVIFDGQGTQWPGMGKDVYQRHGVAREVFRTASEAAGIDMMRACFGDNTYLLNDTRVAQVGITTVGLAKYRAYLESYPEPKVITGLSKGLYPAVGVAAIKTSLESWDHSEIDYETVRLVSERSKIMFDAAQGKNGRMFPVIGPHREDLEPMLKGTGAKIGVYLDKTVHTVTGKEDALENSKRVLTNLKAKVLDYLPIDQAAHSDLQGETVASMLKLLRGLNLENPRIRIAANGSYYLETPEQIIHDLLEQMTGPADWLAVEEMLVLQGIRNVLQVGADEKRLLAKQMVKNNKELNINSIIFPRTT